MCRGTTVEVPEDFNRCIAEGEWLLFVSMNGRVYSWTFDQPEPPIEVHSLGRYSLATGGQMNNFVWPPTILRTTVNTRTLVDNDLNVPL